MLLDTSDVHLCDNLRVQCIWIHDVKVDYTVRSCSSLVYRVTLGENSPIQSFVWKSIAQPKVLFGLLPWGSADIQFFQQIGIVGQAASMCPFAILHVKQPMIFFCRREYGWCDLKL